MRYVRKKLRDIKPGDTVIDINGSPTRVQSLTPVRVSCDVYKITLKNNQGRIATVKADAEHNWPIASVMSTGLAGHIQDRDTLTTRELYEDCLAGNHAMLEPAYGDRTIAYWLVYSVTMIDPIEVECIRVESDTHTFLIATCHDTDRDGDDGQETESLDYVVQHGIPTHNCGGPLTLDTRLRKYMGGTISMGDVHPGDVLVTNNGEPTTVLEESPIMMANTIYEVTLEPA